MTLSKSKRLENIDEALRSILLALGNKHISTGLRADWEGFTNVRPTSWQDLIDRGFVKPCPMAMLMVYEVTGLGWREALKIGGPLEAPEFKSQLGQLLGAFKDRVKGRNSEEFVHPSFTEGLGISEAWVSNVVDAKLIEHCFRRRGVTWRARRQIIRIPVNIGSEPL